ncbi:MAG: hypothetical protein AAFZ65_15850 [Planctomycetota bacterium]
MQIRRPFLRSLAALALLAGGIAVSLPSAAAQVGGGGVGAVQVGGGGVGKQVRKGNLLRPTSPPDAIESAVRYHPVATRP